MTEIVTAVYESEQTVTNTYDDLVSTGIPTEKIRVDKSKCQVQVLSPEVSEREVLEILNRHNPVRLEH